MRGEYSLQRAGRDERDRDRQAVPHRMGRTALVKLTSTGANLAVGKFAAGVIVAVLGPEEEGGTAVFEEVGAATVLVDQVGPGVAATSERVIANRIPYRWISRKRGGGCVVSLTVNARCSGVAISGAFIELLDSTGATVLGSATGSSAVFSIVGTNGYRVRVSKSGYCTKVYILAAPGCGGTASVNANTWPTTYTLPVTALLNRQGVGTCPLPGATIVITGGGTGDGTTNSAGVANISVTTDCNNPTFQLTIVVTPPAGTGAQTTTALHLPNPCNPAAVNVTLPPDAQHTTVVVKNRYISRTFTYSDDYGTCTLTLTLGAWSGSYTFNTPHCINKIECPEAEFPGLNYKAEVGGTVRAYIYLSIGIIVGNVPPNSCDSANWQLQRVVWAEHRDTCFPYSSHCQAIDEAWAYFSDGLFVPRPSTASQFGTVPLTGATIAVNGAVGPSPSYPSADVPGAPLWCPETGVEETTVTWAATEVV